MVKVWIVAEFEWWQRQLLCRIVVWVRSLAVEALNSFWTFQLATLMVTVLDGKLLLAEEFYRQIPLRRDAGKQHHKDTDWYDVLKLEVRRCVKGLRGDVIFHAGSKHPKPFNFVQQCEHHHLWNVNNVLCPWAQWTLPVAKHTVMLSPWNRILNIFAANMHYLSKPPNLSALSKQIGMGTSFISTLQNNKCIIVFRCRPRKSRRQIRRKNILQERKGTQWENLGVCT